jgi:uncharacterized protein (DUF736 family)
MAITLGTFTKSDAGFVGTLRTLNAAAALAIVPSPTPAPLARPRS